MKTSNGIRKILLRKRYLIFYLAFIGWSCSNTEQTDLPPLEKDFPSRTLINAHVLYKDSGTIRINLRSPLIQEYETVDTPYTEFPKGLILNYYNKKIDSPGYLRAVWAKMVEMKGWYEGRGNVVVISENGDTLKTERLFWDKNDRKIFSQDTVYIITKTGDSIQANNGMEAKDDLTEYTLFNNQGMKLYREDVH
jgi:LPS export ABC transporter protein LptC